MCLFRSVKLRTTVASVLSACRVRLKHASDPYDSIYGACRVKAPDRGARRCWFYAACFGALIFSVHGAGAEALQFVNPDLQIGAVTADTNVPVMFVLTNRSDKTVKIADADSSCRCTSLEKSPEEIPAHGSGAFEWTFSSSRATGEVTQVVEVDTTDGQIIIGEFHVTVGPPVETAALQVSTNSITPPAAHNLAAGLGATNAAARPDTPK